MTATARRDLVHAVAPRDWDSDVAWRDRLERDRLRAARNQSVLQRRITEALLWRARGLGAEAFALTGSTARNQRTAISDLDYHVIGARPSRSGLADEVDIVATDVDGFWKRLRGGDDYVQWTLRFGCILFDGAGIFREGLRVLAQERLWPDPTRKYARLPSHRIHAERLIELGDRDAAQEQVRAALTSAARATVLEAGAFPLSRVELPGQLRAIGRVRLASALRATIHGTPSLGDLAIHIRALDDVIHRPRDARSPTDEWHVIRNDTGGWDIYRPGSTRVSSRHRTQREAVGRAREIVGNRGGGEVVVHARDGRVRDRDTVGPQRPSPSRG